MITSTIEYPYNVDASEITKNLQALAKNSGVTLSGGGVENVTVMGGALAASIKGSTLYLKSADKEPKASADFTLSPTNISLTAYQPVTVTATHLGDGLVKCYNNQFIKVQQINANDFRLIPQYEGEGSIGFWLDETEAYYGAAANVSITAENSATAFLFHFDDAEEPFLNLGSAEISSVTGSPSIVEGGKFGDCLFATATARSFTGQPLGGKDFTIDFWNKTAVSFELMWNDNKFIGVETMSSYYTFYWGILPLATVKLILNEWQHIAVCYSHSAQKLYFFIGGELVQSKEMEITRENLQRISFSTNSYTDELRILDGVCAWTSDFTPPESPYSA